MLLLGAAFAASETCTVFQIHTTIQGLDAVVSSDACHEYASGSTLSVPCAAVTCLKALKDTASKLPDCTLSASDNGGTSENKLTTLQTGLDGCSADSSSTLTVKAVASPSSATTSSTSPASTTSSGGEDCSGPEVTTVANVYLAAVLSSACQQYVTTDASGYTYISAPCSATQCLAIMENMAEQLPDCYEDGVNLKDDIVQSLASCSYSSGASADPSTAASQCTSSQVSSLAYLTNTLVLSGDCKQYVTATSTEWYIAVPCDATKCLSTVAELVQQMPDCEFEGTNYKEELSLQWQSCSGDSGSSGQGQQPSLRTEAPATNSSNATDTAGVVYSADFFTRALLVLVWLVATD